MSASRPGGWCPSKPREVAELPGEMFLVATGRRPLQRFTTRVAAEKAAKNLASYAIGAAAIVFHAVPVSGWADEYDRPRISAAPKPARDAADLDDTDSEIHE